MHKRALIDIFRQFSGVRFDAVFWDGSRESFGASGQSAFTIIFKTREAAAHLIAECALGFGEAYVEGGIEIEGDIEAWMRLRYQAATLRWTAAMMLAKILATVQEVTRRAPLVHHYDQGNDLYEMILGKESMLYSAGKYDGENLTLNEAQQRKLSFLGDWLELPKGAKVLELGCGWGGFLMFAAAQGWKADGYLGHGAQYEYTRERIRAARLEEQVSVARKDMFGELPDKEYEGVIMIESIEHIPQRDLPEFFGRVARVLKKDGRLILQLTGRRTPRNIDRWTLKYIFPNGHLPSKAELLRCAESAGFKVEVFSEDTDDYVRTVSAWIGNLEAHRTEITGKYGGETYRTWEVWLHGAKVALEAHTMDLFRVRLRKGWSSDENVL